MNRTFFLASLLSLASLCHSNPSDCGEGRTFFNPGVTFTGNGPGGEFSFGRAEDILWGGVLQYESRHDLFNAGVESGMGPFLAEAGYSMSNSGNAFYLVPDLAIPLTVPPLVVNFFYRYYFGYKNMDSFGVSLKLIALPILCQ